MNKTVNLRVLSTFFEDNSKNIYHHYTLDEDQYIAFFGQLVDAELCDFMEAEGSQLTFIDFLNEDGWDLTQSGLKYHDIELPKTIYEIVLTIDDAEYRRKVQVFINTGHYYIEGEGHLLW